MVGSQFEWIVGLARNSLSKTVTKDLLFWIELKEVLFDIENVLNSRPLNYSEVGNSQY